MMQLGFSQAVIEQGIIMLGECPWTSKLFEQLHSAVNSLKGAHNVYGRDTMMARAIVLQCRSLFRRDAEEYQLVTLRNRIARLQVQQLEKITGRHMFARALKATATLYKKNLGKTRPRTTK